MRSNALFVLGGEDLEMATIRSLLVLAGVRHIQPNKGWGAQTYGPAALDLAVVEEAVIRGKGAFGETYYGPPAQRCFGVERVVFVECAPAKEWPSGTPAVVVDHHGENSSRPPAVQQVLALLGLPISDAMRRWTELVGANDAGYIPAMKALGATPDEVEHIRALDRGAQGVTPVHEAEAERAIGAREVIGRLTVVRMGHSKTSPVADRLYGVADQLLILSEDGEANFYGDGAICAGLVKGFAGWSGGAGLGKAGQPAYWGVSGSKSEDEVIKLITSALS